MYLLICTLGLNICREIYSTSWIYEKEDAQEEVEGKDYTDDACSCTYTVWYDTHLSLSNA